MYYVIGDSHAAVFSSNSMFKVTPVNYPRGAYWVSEHWDYLLSVINKMDKTNDHLILVFGEVDCRLHIYYQFKKRGEAESISQLINATIQKYDEDLRKIQELGIKFHVLGIAPANMQENTFRMEWYAPLEVRAAIYREFNEKLKEHCKRKGYRFLDVYSETADEHGLIKKEYAVDETHLNQKILPHIIMQLEAQK
jgi:lysophospholipase L1-like esterase